MEQPDWLSGQKEGNSPLPKVILLCCENSESPWHAPSPALGGASPFQTWGCSLLPHPLPPSPHTCGLC